MKILLILLYLIILTNCGVLREDSRRFKDQIPEVDYYVDIFKDIAEIESIDVGFGFVSESEMEGKAGLCIKHNNMGKRYAEIWLNLDEWEYYNDLQREWLVLHELGHCVLNKDHNDRKLSDGCPESIMRSYLINYWESQDCYQNKYEHYINEFIN